MFASLVTIGFIGSGRRPNGATTYPYRHVKAHNIWYGPPLGVSHVNMTLQPMGIRRTRKFIAHSKTSFFNFLKTERSEVFKAFIEL